MASKKKNRTSPYLVLACVLCLTAFVLLVSILILASQSEPALPSGEPSGDGSALSAEPSGDVSRPSAGQTSAATESEEESSSSALSQDTPSNGGDIIIDISGSEEESSEPEKDPDPGAAGPFEQLAETQAYEKEIGLRYSTDLTAFEKYIDPADASEYLLLVSPAHPLPSDYKPDDLIHIKDIRSDRPDYISYLREYAEKALEAFLEEGRAYGIDDVRVTNGYRSYAIQSSWFNQYLKEERAKHPDWTEEQVYAYVASYSNPPGTSEHQSGLCVDMHNQWTTDNSFDNTPAAIWLAENCYRFGFILRYPKDKTDITGIIHESWHFRYVGRTAATEMHELGMCLEEYLEYKGLI